MQTQQIEFPEYSGIRCLMMPYIQGETDSLPKEYHSYNHIIEKLYFVKGEIGFLTIDESPVKAGKAHRASRAKYERAIHTEVGVTPNKLYAWGGGHWGSKPDPRPTWGGGRSLVTLEKDTQILLANNMDDTCALWDAEHIDTTEDGDLGHLAHLYPYETARLMKCGEVHQIGIFTPHESIPVTQDYSRQFLRIISKGVHGRELYFTENPLVQLH